jgi:hypothetical protein
MLCIAHVPSVQCCVSATIKISGIGLDIPYYRMAVTIAIFK